MPEERSRRTTGKTRRRSSNGRRRSPEAENPTAASDDAQPEDEAGGEEVEESGGDEQAGGERSVTSELKSAVREAAIEVLTPVARKATTSAAKLAVTKGPDLVKDNVLPKVASAGGPKGIAEMVKSKGGDAAGGLMSKLGGGGDGGDGGDGGASGTGRGRRLPIQESVDVAVPVETAYNQFTQFEEFPEFMHRVERVEQKDETHLMWHENIWGVRRQWEAEITDQTPNERIAWESASGSPQQKGVVTFHSLSDRLTRIEINLDQQPKGLFEKTASGFRMTRRALKSDLMRFKAFVETRDEETGAWRGEIEEGEVVEGREGEEPEDQDVEGREEGAEPEGSEEEEPQAAGDEEPEATEEEEPEASEEEPETSEEEEEEPPEEEPEAYEEEPVEEEPEEEEKPRKRRPARSRR